MPKGSSFTRGFLALAFGGVIALGLTLLPLIGECSVTSIRAGLLPGGARIVIDLDQPSPYSLIKSGRNLEVSVKTSIAGITTGEFPSNNSASSYQAYPYENGMILRIHLQSERISVNYFPLSNPDRIVIDLFPGEDILNGVILADKQQSVLPPASNDERIVPLSPDMPVQEDAGSVTPDLPEKISDRGRIYRLFAGFNILGTSLFLFVFLLLYIRSIRNR